MSLLARISGGSRRSSATKAKERLQLVLIHDRSGISPGKLDLLKDDLITVISRHVEVDQSMVEVSLSNDRDQQVLVANIPLASGRARRK